MDATDVVAGVLLLGVFVVLITACLLVLRQSLRLLQGPRTPRPPLQHLRRPPDDWDDEEYTARHHH
jgi:hypothetical protein